MLRSVATLLLVAATGIQATLDGDFGVWRVVAGEQTCDGVFGCRQSFTVTSDGNAENKLPGFSATVSQAAPPCCCPWLSVLASAARTRARVFLCLSV